MITMFAACENSLFSCSVRKFWAYSWRCRERRWQAAVMWY